MTAVSIERGIDALRQQVDSPIASYMSSCIHCGLCAQACLFYTETQDPKYTPQRKMEPLYRVWKNDFTLLGRLASMVGLGHKVTDEFLDEWEELIYDSCTLCGRCTVACPVGIDITYVIRKTREGMVASGHAPEGLIGAASRAVEGGGPMGDLLPALKAVIRRSEAATGITVPLDVEGADYMVILSAQETVGFPEIVEAYSQIFQQAGVSWTISTETFEGTNVGIQIGSRDIARTLVQRVVDAAEKLKVKYVIAPECGHAYTALRWEGPNLIGRTYDFDVVHITELVDQLVKEGRIKFKSKHKGKITYHDPCQTGRRGGILSPPRALLAEISENLVEMEDAGLWNWCCGGGGGVGANERAEELRLQVFQRKKRQLDGVKPDELVTSCANCRNMIEEALDHYEMDLPVLGLTEMVAEYMETDQTKEPAGDKAAEGEDQ
ncbi:MAG: (Fe-S)-binding protein [Rhodospirillales bacterium]|nr:(Fe-S)-binding protein [Rhodospirillales bacterium]